jgi:preprotein translocase subunit SecF
LAAVLTVIGYSLNDTIVIFDRVRENFRKLRKATPIEVMNQSINQTLSRTIMTSVLTLFVVLALYFLGGSMLHGFSLALIIGIVVGTYSSIYVAGSLSIALGLTRQLLLPVPKEALDERP